MIETVISSKLDQFASTTETPIPPKNRIILYYQNHYHEQYKNECDALKGIIKRGITPTDPDTTIDFRIYCKPNLTRSLIMRNSTAPKTSKEASTNVIYKFICQESRCDGSSSYIGRTSTSLKRRLQYHRNQGSIFQHYTEHHNMKPPLQQLIANTTILHRESTFRRMQIAEAVSIVLQHPSINVQLAADFVLPSLRPLGPHQQMQEQNTNEHPLVYPAPHQSNPTGPVTRSQARISVTSYGSERATPQPISARHSTPSRLG